MGFNSPTDNAFVQLAFEGCQRLLDVSNGKESSLICRIFKTKSGHKISKTKGISYSGIGDIFKGYISEITTTPENFGLHSLRSVGTSAVANNGILDRLISKQGCWSSEKARNGFFLTLQ